MTIGRPRKQKVDYFPHYCKHGKTMKIIQQRFGNNGYAVWFKTLEILGDTVGHALDLSDAFNWEFYVTEMGVSEAETIEIVNLLAKLKAIDPQLWVKKKVIWSDNFVAEISVLYDKRVLSVPEKPLCESESIVSGDISSGKATFRDFPGVEERRVEESREETPPLSPPRGSVRKTSNSKANSKKPIPENFTISDSVRQWAKEKGHTHLDDHLEWFRDWAAAGQKTYADWDAVFRNAIRGNWSKVDLTIPEKPPPRQICKSCGAWQDKCVCTKELTNAKIN